MIHSVITMIEGGYNMVKLLDKMEIKESRIDYIRELSVKRSELEKYGVSKEKIERYSK